MGRPWGCYKSSGGTNALNAFPIIETFRQFFGQMALDSQVRVWCSSLRHSSVLVHLYFQGEIWSLILNFTFFDLTRCLFLLYNFFLSFDWIFLHSWKLASPFYESNFLFVSEVFAWAFSFFWNKVFLLCT